MADLLTTLHPINDDTTDLYPNVKRDNLPQNVKDELDAIPNKVDKVQGKGLSTNDFTNEDKALVDTIPDKVDKVTGKGLSTNDYTNADKALVDTIPFKVNKEQGKGLSTNDFTNANKTALELTIPSELSSLRAHILNLYRMVIRSGDMITVTDASVSLTSQPFPLTVSPKALLNYVGGMCQKIGDSIITAPVTMVVSKGNVNIYYPIHPDIQSLDGYGYGLSADCYNYIDFERKVFVKKVISYTFTGNENWVASSNGNAYFATIAGLSDVVRKPTNITTNFSWQMNNAGLTTTNASALYAGTALSGVGLHTNGNLWISASDYANRDNLVGKTIYFELATPVETDISDLLVLSFPTYDIINVLPGGYLEFENENNIGVPYSVTYQSKPNTQANVLSIAQPAISEVDSNDPTNPL